MKFICFKTTTDDKKIANAICETAVSKGYSPCTSIKKIQSNYIWNEKNVKSDEYQIEIKSIEKYSNYIVELIKNLKIRNVTLAGESIGGVLSATVAVKLPQIIKKLFLFNPYDYDNYFGEGIGRGNLFARFINLIVFL